MIRSIFNKVEKDDLDILNDKKNVTVYKKGKTIFCNGTRPGSIYCLNQGVIKIFKYGAYGKEQIIRFAVPGELFGLRALLADRNYNTTATVIEDAIVCSITRSNFMQVLLKYPQMSVQIMTSLSQQLEDADNRITSMAQKTVRERVAESLVWLFKTFHGDKPFAYNEISLHPLSLSREDLANIVGTSTETVIRLLSEFKKDHMISIKGRKIFITDIKGLMKIGNV
ncbi:MAG: Crp/Fnr family transcriptional regulator [Bacteroidota bacterium]